MHGLADPATICGCTVRGTKIYLRGSKKNWSRSGEQWAFKKQNFDDNIMLGGANDTLLTNCSILTSWSRYYVIVVVYELWSGVVPRLFGFQFFWFHQNNMLSVGSNKNHILEFWFWFQFCENNVLLFLIWLWFKKKLNKSTFSRGRAHNEKGKQWVLTDNILWIIYFVKNKY